MLATKSSYYTDGQAYMMPAKAEKGRKEKIMKNFKKILRGLTQKQLNELQYQVSLMQAAVNATAPQPQQQPQQQQPQPLHVRWPKPQQQQPQQQQEPYVRCPQPHTQPQQQDPKELLQQLQFPEPDQELSIAGIFLHLLKRNRFNKFKEKMEKLL